jgi:hypothetical protein
VKGMRLLVKIGTVGLLTEDGFIVTAGNYTDLLVPKRVWTLKRTRNADQILESHP